jgi:hypothetical protein
VLSHWSGGICTASNRLDLGAASKLATLILNALEQAATHPLGSSSGSSTPSADLLAAIRKIVRPRLAQVVLMGERFKAPRTRDKEKDAG